MWIEAKQSDKFDFAGLVAKIHASAAMSHSGKCDTLRTGR